MTERGHRLVPDPLDVGPLRDICGHDERGRGNVRRHAVERIRRTRGEDEAVAPASELARDSRANTPAGAGDDDDALHEAIVDPLSDNI